ncbi:MAG: cyclic nucleotide-binding domain-containing protein [Deltaproteobacteria bacterium]|nr:cyclic nucleotide-binding domain-containing protein [Deltaproteobacteria bacterium]
MLPTDSLFRAQLAALSQDPKDLAARVVVAVALLESGEAEGARLLRGCLRVSLHVGQPVTALWALGLLRRYAPLASNDETLRALAARYARTLPDVVHLPDLLSEVEQARLDEEEARRAVDLGAQVEALRPLSGAALVARATAAAGDLSAFDLDLSAPPALGALSLFNAFSEQTLLQLLNALELRLFTQGDQLIEEGEEARGVFVVCCGRVDITRRTQEGETIDLATLGAGALVGEMGLITNSPRVATATAHDDVWALMLPAPAYALMRECKEEVYASLSHLVGGRMLQNITKFSPVFRALPRSAHAELLREFKSMVVQPGEVLLRQGERGRGLFLILDGLVRVNQLGSLEPRWLREGDIFGETSLVYDSPVTATCTAVRRSLLFMLSPERFKQMLDQFPEVRHSLSELSLFRNLDELYTLT